MQVLDDRLLIGDLLLERIHLLLMVRLHFAHHLLERVELLLDGRFLPECATGDGAQREQHEMFFQCGIGV